jgi:calcineurin-like phosphoesterase family protein
MKYSTIKIDISKQNLFFTGDHHFCHANVIKYCNRPFKDVEEMNTALVNNWNSVVDKNDIVFHAGDFCFGGTKQWVYILERLNGRIYLAAGNHDKSIPVNRFVKVEQRFNLLIQDGAHKQRITIDHYPLTSWYQSGIGSWMLHGHCHGMFKDYIQNRMDVGVDVHKYKPISFLYIKNMMETYNFKT